MHDVGADVARMAELTSQPHLWPGELAELIELAGRYGLTVRIKRETMSVTDDTEHVTWEEVRPR